MVTIADRYRFMSRALTTGSECHLREARYHHVMADTKTAKRRTLRFNSLDDLLADARRLQMVESQGRLTLTGNWTLGQIFGHLAAWMSYPYDGFPMGQAPWLVRLIVGMQTKKFLATGLPAGVRIPGSPDGTYGVERISTEEGMKRLETAVARIKSGAAPTHPSPVFGRTSHEEVVQGNLRHAELHLSFAHEGEAR